MRNRGTHEVNQVNQAVATTTAVNQKSEGKVEVSRALKSHNLWLTVTYVGLILLMARAYA